MGRYDKNMMTLSPKENADMKFKKVCVIGCGGLGGYVIEMLGRLGVGFITVVDGDVFQESNLNRQIFSDEEVIGESKVLKVAERMKKVNSEVSIREKMVYLNQENAADIVKGHDVIVDALDNIGSRLILEEACEKENIPFVHAAIAGWYAQVTTVFPGDRSLSKIYKNQSGRSIEQELGNPSFTPAFAASIQVSEVVKLLIGRGEPLRRRMIYANVLEQRFIVIDI